MLRGDHAPAWRKQDPGRCQPRAAAPASEPARVHPLARTAAVRTPGVREPRGRRRPARGRLERVARPPRRLRQAPRLLREDRRLRHRLGTSGALARRPRRPLARDCQRHRPHRPRPHRRFASARGLARITARPPRSPPASRCAGDRVRGGERRRHNRARAGRCGGSERAPVARARPPGPRPRLRAGDSSVRRPRRFHGDRPSSAL